LPAYWSRNRQKYCFALLQQGKPHRENKIPSRSKILVGDKTAEKTNASVDKTPVRQKMNCSILGICVLMIGCVSLQDNSMRVSPDLADRGPIRCQIQVVEQSTDSAFYDIRAGDGRLWRIPTSVYVPSKLGNDETPMQEGCKVYQVYSEYHQIIGLQESCGGEWISRRLLFIKGNVAKLFDVNTAYRSREGLRDGEPSFWYTWAIDSIRKEGVVLEGVYFRWKDLGCELVGTYSSEPDGAPNP
jgi:hypothetical protein